MRSGIGLLLLALLTSCVQSNATVCANGRVCPADYACDEVHGLCVLPEQLTTCGPADATCTLPTGAIGTCDQGVCIEDVCGDGLVTGTEDCEPGDGTTWNCATDGGYYNSLDLECSDRCVFPESMCTGTCGDGVLDGPPGQEVCDKSVPAGGCFDYGFEAGRLACNNSACAPAFAACRDIGFVSLYPTSGRQQSAAYIASSDHVFILDGVASLFEVQGGAVVKHVAIDGATVVSDLWGASPTDIHVTDYDGSIHHYDGTSWTVTQPASSIGLTALWGTGANDVYAVGYNEHIYHNTGSGWQLLYDGGGSFREWTAIHGSSATSIFVVGGMGRVRRLATTWMDMDASACWGSLPNPTFNGVWSSGPSDAYAAGRLSSGEGILCHYNGATWARVDLGGTVGALNGIWGRAHDDIFAATEDGTVLNYNGHVWRRLDVGDPSALAYVTGTSDTVVVLGTNGAALRYTRAGYASELFDRVLAIEAPDPKHEYVMNSDFVYQRTPAGWAPLGPGALNYYSAMWADDATGALVVADQAGPVNHFDGTGAMTTSSLSFEVRGLGGRSPTDVFAVGSNGKIARYTGSWAAMTSNTTAKLDDVDVTQSSAFAVGSLAGAAFITRHNGANWDAMTVPSAPPLSHVYAASDTDVFAVGEGGTILHYDGTAWTAMDTGVVADLFNVDGTSGKDVFAAGAGGILIHYDGIAWNPVRGQTLDTRALAVRTNAVLFGGLAHEVRIIVRDTAW